MQFSLKILESNSEISNQMLQALLPQVNKYMESGMRTIKNELPSIISESIHNTMEYSSLLSGQLQYEFGIPDPGPKLAGLINIWSNNIEYLYTKPTINSGKIKSSFSANTIRADYSDVLNSDYATVIDTARGYSLPWLEWLLLEGNRTIISKHEVILGANKFSRTGNAIMRPSNKAWKVPGLYAGTASDNWITRAIDNSADKINTLLNKAFQL